MKKISIISILILSVIACSKKENNLFVSGKIDGLKKGTLYLQKLDDTVLVNLDSIVMTGDPEFALETFIESPEIMYLHLDKIDNDDYDDRIEFFAEAGEIVINSTLKNLVVDAKISGSINHEKLAEFNATMRKFQDQNLELIKDNFDAQVNNDEELLVATNEKYNKLLRRKYLYTVNYALNHKNLEIAPYLALSEVFDANIKYLDTIYNSLEPNVQKSKYGKELKDFLKERRDLDKIDDEVEVVTEEVVQ